MVVKAGVRVPVDQEGEASTLLSDSLRQLQSLSHADSSKEVTADPEKQRMCHSPGLWSGLVWAVTPPAPGAEVHSNDPGVLLPCWGPLPVCLRRVRDSHKAPHV